MVSLNPQLIGNIIARILRVATSDGCNTGFIPTLHFAMILGGPGGNVDKDDIVGFFRDLNLFLDVEGTTIVPSCAPSLPILPVDLGTLELKRSFFLAYLPQNLWNDFATMLLMGLVAQNEGMEYSLDAVSSANVNPISLQSGAKLYVWEHNILMTLNDKSTFYVCLDRSPCDAEGEYLYRHIDVWLSGTLEVQAKWMAVVSDVFQTVSC